MSIFTQSHSKYTKIVKIIHFRSINAMKHFKPANTWNLAAKLSLRFQRSASALKFHSRPVGVPALGHRSAGAQPHSSRIFQRQALLGWRSALILSHFSRLNLEFWGSTSHQKIAHILVFVGRCFTWFHDPNWHLHGSVV